MQTTPLISEVGWAWCPLFVIQWISHICSLPSVCCPRSYTCFPCILFILVSQLCSLSSILFSLSDVVSSLSYILLSLSQYPYQLSQFPLFGCKVDVSPTDVSPTESSCMLRPLNKAPLGYYALDRCFPTLDRAAHGSHKAGSTQLSACPLGTD